MGRYIDADNLIEAWCKELNIEPDDRGAAFIGYQQVIRFINVAPTADVTPVKHGKWELHYDPAGRPWQICDQCDAHREMFGFYEPYCPVCGAKMDKEQEHE